MAGPDAVDEYLAALPEAQRATLEALRRTIRAAAPEATETIAYQMPAYRVNGRFVVSFAAFKQHCSLFPASEMVMAELGDALGPHVAGKGTLRFSADDPIPAAVVTRMVEIRLTEVGAPRRR
jgi:uncharacterized protein YdhG (YjbR/CyaY superfamily)